jgi:hypothetical protein
MSHDGLRDQIIRLEGHIEEVAELAERLPQAYSNLKAGHRWRGISLLAITLGEIGLDPVTMIGAIAVVLGGIVVFGSNTSTFDIKTEETLRAELIGKMDLRTL